MNFLIKRTSKVISKSKIVSIHRFFGDKDPFSKNNVSFNQSSPQLKQDSGRNRPPIDSPLTNKNQQEFKSTIVDSKTQKLTDNSGQKAIEVKKSSLSATIKEGMKHMMHGLKMVYRDFLRYKFYINSRPNIEQYTVKEYMDKERIKEDLIKFIPYGIMLVMPAGELFIPPYIALFPNASPSQFFNEESIGKVVERNEERQKEAFEALFPKIQSFFQSEFEEINQLKKALKEDPFNIQLSQRIAQIDNEIANELCLNWPKYKKKLKFVNLSVNEMDYVMKFMFINYLNGVHIINTLLNTPRHIYNAIARFVLKSKSRVKLARYSFDFMPFNSLRRNFLEMQLERAFKNLEIQDIIASVHPQSLVQMSSTEIYTFARQRGIRVDHDQDRVKYYKQVWIPQSDKTQKLELKFWVMLIRFNYGKHLV